MNILELCLSPDLGGLELYVAKCAAALGKTDRVYSMLNPHGRLKGYFEKQGVLWDELKPGSRNFPIFTARRLADYMDRQKIDVVHVHWGKDLPLVTLAKWLSKRKPRLVFTRHMNITRPKKDFYHRFIYRQVDLQLVITHHMEKAVKQFMPDSSAKNVVTLYLGTPLPDYKLNADEIERERNALGISQDTFLVGLVGRVKYEKGQHLMVEAVHRLRQKGHDVSGLIVGRVMNEAYQDRLAQSIERDNLQGVVKILSFVDEPQRIMQLCDTVVMASYNETFGLVLVEAMRSGIAVIGPDSGGATEIVENGKTGLLFEVGNAASLAKCIEQLYVDPDYREQLAEQGKRRADANFNDSFHFDKLQKLLINSQL